jgi:hypothetical protein
MFAKPISPQRKASQRQRKAKTGRAEMIETATE